MSFYPVPRARRDLSINPELALSPGSRYEVVHSPEPSVSSTGSSSDAYYFPANGRVAAPTAPVSSSSAGTSPRTRVPTRTTSNGKHRSSSSPPPFLSPSKSIDTVLRPLVVSVPKYALLLATEAVLVLHKKKHKALIQALQRLAVEEKINGPVDVDPTRVDVRSRRQSNAMVRGSHTWLVVIDDRPKHNKKKAKTSEEQEKKNTEARLPVEKCTQHELWRYALAGQHGHAAFTMSTHDVLRFFYVVITGSLECQVPETWQDLPTLFQRLLVIHDADHAIHKNTPFGLSTATAPFPQHQAVLLDPAQWHLNQLHSSKKAREREEKKSDVGMTFEALQEQMGLPSHHSQATFRDRVVAELFEDQGDDSLPFNTSLVVCLCMVRVLLAKNGSPSFLSGIWQHLATLLQQQEPGEGVPDYTQDNDVHPNAQDVMQQHSVPHTDLLIEEALQLAGKMRLLMARVKRMKSLGSALDPLLLGTTAGTTNADCHTLWDSGTTHEALQEPVSSTMCVLTDLLCPTSDASVMGTVMSRGLSSIYNDFVRQLQEMNDAAKTTNGHRGALRFYYLHFSRLQLLSALNLIMPSWFRWDHCSKDAQHIMAHCSVYISAENQFVTFARAGVMTWRFLGIASMLRLLRVPARSTDRFRLLPLYPSVTHYMAAETLVLPTVHMLRLFTEAHAGTPLRTTCLRNIEEVERDVDITAKYVDALKAVHRWHLRAAHYWGEEEMRWHSANKCYIGQLLLRRACLEPNPVVRFRVPTEREDQQELEHALENILAGVSLLPTSAAAAAAADKDTEPKKKKKKQTHEKDRPLVLQPGSVFELSREGASMLLALLEGNSHAVDMVLLAPLLGHWILEDKEEKEERKLPPLREAGVPHMHPSHPFHPCQLDLSASWFQPPNTDDMETPPTPLLWLLTQEMAAQVDPALVDASKTTLQTLHRNAMVWWCMLFQRMESARREGVYEWPVGKVPTPMPVVMFMSEMGSNSMRYSAAYEIIFLETQRSLSCVSPVVTELCHQQMVTTQSLQAVKELNFIAPHAKRNKPRRSNSLDNETVVRGPCRARTTHNNSSSSSRRLANDPHALAVPPARQ